MTLNITIHYFTVFKTVITIETGDVGGATLVITNNALRHEETNAESSALTHVGISFVDVTNGIFTAMAQAVTATTTGLTVETTVPRPLNTCKTSRA